MSVDINTYRCRVGLFVSSRGAGMAMMPFVVDFSHEIKLIGAVSFIRILLIIAGIEQNPGPTDQFIYRYQYLLIEIGTEVLRKVFDNQVNNDFMRYLNAKPNQNIRLQFLIHSGIITDAQKKFLPPWDMKPTSSNFDITLLVCLLRNVCSLRSHTDTVWKNPSPTDLSLEADIARLRVCRNDLAHLGTVYISEADLTTKWSELSTILKRLNPARGITNLSSLIDHAEHLDIDKELKDKFDVAIKSWVEMDMLFNEGIKELKLGQSELKDGQSGLKTGQSELKDGQSEMKDGQSGLKTGQSEIKAGQSELKDGQSELKAGQSELMDGQSELKEGQSELKDGQSGLKTGQSELKNCQSELKDGQSELKAGQSELKEGQSELKNGQSGLKDGQSGLKTGQSELKDGQSEIKDGQSGLKTGQSEMKVGQSELKDGQSELKAGQSEFMDGQSELKEGQSELKDGQSGLKTGQSELKDCQSELKDGQSELKAGQSELKEGHSELKDGQSELKAGQSELKEGQSELKDGQSGLKTGQSELKNCQSELKDGQSELKAGQSELKEGHSELKNGQSELKAELKEGQQSILNRIDNLEQIQQKCKHSKSIVETDFKDHLMKIYRKRCSTLPASPLCCNDDKVDLLTFYQPPTMSYVRYHREQTSEKNCSISSYEEIFRKDDKKIYITGDAGVGKTSFCQCMALLWCKSQSGEHVNNSSMQKDIDFMAKFEFVFYVSLRESAHEDILDMIIDQFFYTKSKDNREEMYKYIEKVLKERECLIILDGLDEWSPKTSARKECVLPKKVPSERCIHLTTCRPYIIENNRLSRNDLDHQVQITGIHGLSSKRYISAIVNHVNGLNKDNKNPEAFMKDAKLCGLDELLSIPMITSQLIVVWFDKKLTGMSRALIYSTIVEMLFERAEMRKIPFPSPTDSKVPLPVSLSEFIHLKNHFSLLKELCFLSFRSLFKQDECSSVLVYTKQFLMKEPYSFSAEKIDFLCKIGILSKNKFIGRFGNKEHKLSFLHKSYVEFYAALYVSSFDTSNLFDSVVKEWSNRRFVEQFQNFSLLLAGFSAQKVKFLFETICPSISEDVFHYDRLSYIMKVKPLQNMVIAFFREIRRSTGQNIELKLEEFIFEKFCNVDSLRQLLSLNAACVKSIWVEDGKYLDEFDLINSLQCLHICDVLPDDYAKFTKCMFQNLSTLHTVSIKGRHTLIPELPLRCLQHLTSLSLSGVKMHHKLLCNLTKFLSENVRFENIKLDRVLCDSHQEGAIECASTLNLPNHTKLTSLFLNDSPILCRNVNKSNLKFVMFSPFKFALFNPIPVRIVKDVDVLFNCIEGSQLKYLNFMGSALHKTLNFDYNTMKILTSTVKSLQYIKSLTLHGIRLPDDVLLQLHPDVTQVSILLHYVTMSRQCFHCFIDSLACNKSVIKVELQRCEISSVGETRREQSLQKSVEYMSEYLRKAIPTVNLRLTSKIFFPSFVSRSAFQSMPFSDDLISSGNYVLSFETNSVSENDCSCFCEQLYSDLMSENEQTYQIIFSCG